MRSTCAHWRSGLAEAPARLRPLVRAWSALLPLPLELPPSHALPAVCCTTHAPSSSPRLPLLQGKPARLAAFPRALELDYCARGGGQALTDGDLSAACAAVGGRLQRLDIGGAFQLTPEGLAAALRACPALRHLAADGSTLQDAAFAGLLAGACGGSGGDSGSSSSTNTRSVFGPRTAPSCAPLQQLEGLSLRGCLFLRGRMLADLAAACPRLASLDLAGCGLALQ